MARLNPTQESLPNTAARTPDSFLQDGNRIDIHYFRSGRTPDNLTTDDEFTPYVFTDGILTAIGWQALGGVRTTGQVVQPAPRVIQNVEVQNNIPNPG